MTDQPIPAINDLEARYIYILNRENGIHTNTPFSVLGPINHPVSWQHLIDLHLIRPVTSTQFVLEPLALLAYDAWARRLMAPRTEQESA